MTEPTAAHEQEQHTTTIEITGNGQINAAFENTEGPEGAPTPQTPPPPPNHIQRPMTPPPQVPRPNTPPPQIPTTPQHETPHMNGETPHMNGDTKSNGVEVRTPGSEDTKEVNEAVNLELVNMQPYSNSIPIKKESTELDIGDPYDEYFVPVNQHKKYMRGEKLYVTQDKRRSLGGSKKKCCWGVLTVIVLGGIVAILIGVILSSQESVPVEESRNFNGMKASIGGNIIPTPSPSSTPAPTRPTTDMSEIYLNNVLQGELTIDNLEFTPGLADKNSSEFRSLAASLEEELKSALFDHQMLHYGSADINVKVLEFRSGSVIVVYRVGWEFKDGIKNPPDPIDKDGLKTKLQDHLRSHDGFLYNYRLTTHNLKSERVTNTCKIENGGCSQDCMFDRNSLEIMCTCEDPYVLHSDGKSCIKPEKSEPGLSSEETPSSTSEHTHAAEHEHGGEHEHGHEHGGEHEHVHEHGGEHEHGHEHGDEHEHGGVVHEHGGVHEQGPGGEIESSSEVYKTTEDQNNYNTETDEAGLPAVTEHSSEHDYHFETELPPEHENFGMKDSSIETYVTPIPEHKHDNNKGQTSQPLSEHTQYMYENTYYQPMDNSEYKKSPESDRVQVAMTEGNEQTTEPMPQMKSTDVSMNFDSSSEPKSSSELPTYQHPMNFSDLPMESEYSTSQHQNEEIKQDTNPETTPMPPINVNLEENTDPNHDLMDNTKVMVENTNFSESTSSSLATSSERLPKYNQFLIGGSDEDSMYSQTTEKDLMPETTAMFKESGEKNIVPELNTQESSEKAPFFHSSSEPSVSYTQLPEEIQTEKMVLDNSEIKSSEYSMNQNNENTMTTASLFYTEPKEDDNSAEVSPATKIPLNAWESGNQSNNTSHESSTNAVEETLNLQKITTMMPVIQGEEVDQNGKLMMNLNSSQTAEVSSSENITDYMAEVTTQTSQNGNSSASSQTLLNEKEETMPTERTNGDSDDNPTDLKSIDLLNKDLITTSIPSLVESETMQPDSSPPSELVVINPHFMNKQNSSNSNETLTNTDSAEELNQGTTEKPMETNSFLTPGLTETPYKPNMETDNDQPTSNISNSSVQQSAHLMGESKIPFPDNSDSTVPTFLVGGENMPPIALTPNPDLSGPYSVDSTIQPIPEEEDGEEIKPANSFNSGDSNDAESLPQWYDSKNGLNSLDDDYNEEEKYANYKSAKGKPDHLTKGYKSIKIEEKSRVPEDSDAVEQTHSHQIEHVPTSTSEKSNTVYFPTTETNESVTTHPSPEGSPSKIKEEEKLLIKEVYTEPTSATGVPNDESERLSEAQSSSQDLNDMKSDPNKLIDNHNMETSDDSLMKEINNNSTQNMSHGDNNERNNYYAVTEKVEDAEFNSTTSGNLHPSGGSTIEESIPRTTIFYESNSASNNKTECDSEHFACRDGSKCLMKFQQCDSMQDCADGSDEEDCDKLDCVENFKCNDGMCLSKHLVCNGIQNCQDGNDEENCDSEKMKHIMEQPTEIEPKGTESPLGKMVLGPNDSMENVSGGSTDMPGNAMEAAKSGTETNVMKEEKPVISGTESHLSSAEPAMTDKEPDSRSMDLETATLSIPMETVINSKEPGQTESLPSSTEATMAKEAPLNPMESAADPNMNSNETSVSSIESVDSTANLNSTMESQSNDHETSVTSSKSENNGTELPMMSNMKYNESPVTSEPAMDNTEKPLSSIAHGMEAPINSMDTNMSDNEMPATPMPSEGANADLVSTSVPVMGEVSQSSDEMTSVDLAGSNMSSTTALPSKIESIPADPSANNTSTTSNNSSGNSRQDNSSSQITVSSTEPSPTVMESSTSHSENPPKITESAPLATDYMSSSNETDLNSTEIPSELMEQIPIQTALS